MSDSIHPQDLKFFTTLAAAGAMSRAAHELQLSTAAVSKRLLAMEARLGLTLVSRTTRHMSLTVEGQTYLRHAQHILGQLAQMERALAHTHTEPRGLLRVNATLGFGRSHIAPVVARFVRQYPEVEVRLQLSADPPPVSDDVFDVCIRFGPPPDSRVIAKKLVANRRLLCAAPSYLAQHGTPQTPQDLAKHKVISIRQGDEAHGVVRFVEQKTAGSAVLKGDIKEDLKDAGAAQATRPGVYSVKVRGNLSTNDGGIAVAWALEGLGVLQRAEWDIARYLASGRLVQVLADHPTADADIYAVYPPQLQSATRVHSFVQAVQAALN